MFKKILMILIVGLFMLGISKLSFATSCHGGSAKEDVPKHSSRGQKQEMAEGTAQKAEQKAVNAGNKICPVSGDKIGSGTMKAVTYEYQGKIYNFCCPMCIDEFKKDPEKYIKKVGEELQAKSREDKKQESSEHEEMEGMHEGHRY